MLSHLSWCDSRYSKQPSLIQQLSERNKACICILNIFCHYLASNILVFPTKNVFLNSVSLMESLDSTLETKRPAAALSLLSQQKKPQAVASSEGQTLID